LLQGKETAHLRFSARNTICFRRRTTNRPYGVFLDRRPGLATDALIPVYAFLPIRSSRTEFEMTGKRLIIPGFE
jgi:hypothetical protein